MKTVTFELVLHMNKYCNASDEAWFRTDIPILYNYVANLFNEKIDDWNKAWNALHPEVEELTEENGWLDKYNHFIKNKMYPLCGKANSANKHLSIYVMPTDDAYYKFHMRKAPWKMCEFSLKPID